MKPGQLIFRIFLLSLFSILFWATFLFFMVITPFFSLIFMPLFLSRKRSYRFFVRFFSKIWLGMLGQIPRVTGIENVPKTGGLILISNHWSALDFFLFNSVMPRFINIFVGRIFYNFLTVPILSGAYMLPEDNRSPAVAALSMARAIESINKGEAIAIFPESVIFDRPAASAPLKAGMYKIIESTNAVIIPVNVKRGFPLRFPFIELRPEIAIGKPLDRTEVLRGGDRFIRENIKGL